MIDVLLFFLITGLILVGTAAFRMLMKHQTNQMIKTLEADPNLKPDTVKVPPAKKPSYVLQESSKLPKK